MNIVLIGSGAREHAIAQAISKSNRQYQLYCYSNQTNPGIKKLCQDYRVGDLTNLEAICHFAQKHEAGMAIIGPEAPLEMGLADKLWENNIPAIGPKKQLAQIETSKSFARDLMNEYLIPGCPRYKVFTDLEGLETYLQSMHDKYVIKADGLMGGKGVKVFGEHLHSMADALQYCEQIIEKGQSFVVEKKFVGQEFSLLSYSDGTHLSHMPVVQDHKRALVGDVGPNTGGMGSYSCANHLLPFLTKADVEQAQEINERIIQALYEKYQQPYIGILYGGFMVTKKGVRVIEFNARFGDPEAMNVLSLLETDFIDVCQAMIDGNLNELDLKFKNQATVCKYAVPEGYPDNPIKGEFIDVSEVDADKVYLAAVDEQNGDLIETGSRTVAVLGQADSLAEAEQQAENMINQIQGPLVHRSDIGTKELINQRIMHMNEIRDEHYELL